MTIKMIVTALAVSVAFIACNKEGAFNPKKKISKVTYKNEKGDVTSTEKWNWGKKTLESIDYGNDYIIKFKYDNKDRVTKATYGSDT